MSSPRPLQLIDSRDWLSDVSPGESLPVVLLLLLDSEIQSAQIALFDFARAQSASAAVPQNAPAGLKNLERALVFHQARVFVGAVRRAVEVAKDMIYDKRGKLFEPAVSRELRQMWEDATDRPLFKPYIDTRNAIEHKWDDIASQKGLIVVMNLVHDALEYAPGKIAKIGSEPIERLIEMRAFLIELYKRTWPSGGRPTYSERQP